MYFPYNVTSTPHQIREILATVRETGDRGRNTGAPGKYGRSGNPSRREAAQCFVSVSGFNSARRAQVALKIYGYIELNSVLFSLFSTLNSSLFAKGLFGNG